MNANSCVDQIIQNSNDSNFNANNCVDQILQNSNESTFNANICVDQILQNSNESTFNANICVDQILQNVNGSIPVNKTCKCGSSTHKRITHKECPLNKKLIHNSQANQIDSIDDQIVNNDEITIVNEFKTTNSNNQRKNKNYKIARQKSFSQDMVFGKNVDKNINSPYYGRHLLPPRETFCPFCNALMWIDERLKGTSKKKPRFGMCCLQGAIDLPLNHNLPNEIKALLTSDNVETKDFRTAIRLYNSILSFTSVSANVDESLMNATSGVYTYRINGAVHHKLSSLLPNKNSPQQFSQIYIMDADMQSSHRTGMFPKAIQAKILNQIQEQLNKFNPYVKIYQQAGLKLRADPSMELNIVLKSKQAVKNFNLPTADEIAVLMVENDHNVSHRDVIVSKITTSDSYPHQFISENLSFYDPLGYPLMHIYGESGWQYQTYPKKSRDFLIKQYQAVQKSPDFNVVESNLPLDFYDFLEIEDELEIDLDIDLEGLEPNQLNKSKFISAREFYAFKLQDRPGISALTISNS